METIDEMIASHADPMRAKNSAWFFKTGPGDYGEGDVFLGLTVPLCRTIAKRHRDLPLAGIRRLLAAKEHEKRLIALLILVDQYAQASKSGDWARLDSIYEFYLANTDRINNWDFVDLSSHHIVGRHLRMTGSPPYALLTKLARSRSLWERRIAIVSTAHFIGKGDFRETLRVAAILLHDPHDLIHKATGWMLREVGKRDKMTLCAFLDRHAHVMPRTMLRYAIEKFDKKERLHYMLLARKAALHASI